MGVHVCGLVLLLLFFQCSCLGFISPLSVFKRFQDHYWPPPSECARTGQTMISPDGQNFSLHIRMPGLTPKESDSYFCMSVHVPREEDTYIVDFQPHASMDTVHHMILYGCRYPYATDNYWDCGGIEGTCKDTANIIYAWARDAPPTKLPKDVGFKVGGDTGIANLVLQIHYGDASAFKDKHRDCSGVSLRMTLKPQPLTAGIYLLMSRDAVIPPGKNVVNADIACSYRTSAMHPFAFRTHTHRLGKVVSGYRVRGGKWTLIGRQSPQLPQAFYPANKGVDIRHGDMLAARCVFSGEGKTTETHIGSTSADEMCNFYIMYYMDANEAIPYMNCMQDGNPLLFRDIPREANIPIPVSPDMTMMHGHHSEKASSEDSVLQQPKREEEEVPDQGYHLIEMTDWPESDFNLGQVSGLALDSNNNLVIFHRGDHKWGANTFSNEHMYQQKHLGPIQQDTILLVDPVKGSLLHSTGKNLFFMPHGITTDKNDNYWVTDVALHQVFKIGNSGDRDFQVVLGEAFQPGSDKYHFCQPTDVAIDPFSGNVFVSDGYCNSRILKFSPEGKFITQWGAGSSDARRPLQFNIPHSLAFVPDQGELCVADRQNGRIQCFVAESGEFVKEIKNDEFGGEVFAVSYAPEHGGLIYAVNGESEYGKLAPIQGFVMNYSTGVILDTFRPDTKDFQMPHDLVVARDGTVFVGDATTDQVLKFASSEKAEHRSVKKGGIEVHEMEVSLMPDGTVQESETFLQAKVKPQPSLQETSQEKTKQNVVKQANPGVSPAIITTLLLIPLVVLIGIAVFMRWRKGRIYGDTSENKLDSSSSGILGKLRGKSSGGLNLGNFFASHKGYSRKGFDRLSTEGSDQEKDDEEATDSETEEYSAPPAPVSSSS
ncbi:peptidyl-glycine alpha-amidating monooxygenase B isoform X5 [Erpetoichthys calabaricus]|uniref:peptidyl-glycine alpha-amidating monooxygenase B isoform X5 n=1 Tax=Erpetoichthys calabaricus TaxID=27687 RepID=UPI0022348932|nr:peptidyl-glycine alpha-amidating monooxygenase B isoform X5 [Erpetoichthys calabaricus]